MRKKSDLPQKPCLHCGLPFTWRKKWAKVWDEVRYCSDRCRHERKRSRPATVFEKRAHDAHAHRLGSTR